MKQLKVYGGRNNTDGRMIVAAYTKKQARELSNTSPHEFKHFWCETANDLELRVAVVPGVWVAHHNASKPEDYLRVETI